MISHLCMDGTAGVACDGTAGVASKRACSSVADPTDYGKVRARRRAGAAAPCFPTLGLAQVSLPARPRPHSVLLCVLMPWLSSMAQPDLRLHTVCDRRLSEAAVEDGFDSCRKAARDSSMGMLGRSRRRPWCHHGVAAPVPGAGPRSRPGRPRIVEPAALGYLAGPPGHTIELGRLWNPFEFSRVCM